MNNLYTLEDTPFSGVEENTTIDRDSWLDIMKSRPSDSFIVEPYVSSMDFTIEELLKDVIVAYAEGPVGYHNDEVFKIISRKAYTIEEIEEFKDELENSGQKIIFYMAIRYSKKDDSISHWVIRYDTV